MGDGEKGRHLKRNLDELLSRGSALAPGRRRPGDLTGCWAGTGTGSSSCSGSSLRLRLPPVSTPKGEFAPLRQSRAGADSAAPTATRPRLSHPVGASHTGFLGLVPPPRSLLSGRMSCRFAGLRAPRPPFMCHRPRRPAAELQEEDPGDSDEDPAPRQQGEGQEEPEPPADTDLFRSGCISGLNQGAGSLVQRTSKMPNSVSHSKGLFV